jgi:hypothetical protein
MNPENQIINSEFLDKKYPDLVGSKPVERASKIEGEKGKTPHTRGERIEAYLNRLESVWNTKNEKGEDRGFELLRNKILNEFITTFDEIPESYWRLQETIMRERGQIGDWQNASEEQKNESKKQIAEGILNDQKSSLEQWIDYFHLSDSEYIPKELKYWIFRNIIKLSEFDKEKKEFSKRSKGTVKQFPDINYEALAYVVDAIKDKYDGKKIEWEHDIQTEERKSFEEYLNKEDFAKLYAWANELMNPVPEHLLPVTDGEWRKFNQGSEPTELTKTIRGKGTGWCTAGEQTAKTQLSAGDFYVFYSKDDNQQSTIPRIAIRMEGGKIAEVRGISFKQNLDPFMGEVLEKKLDEFPDKEEYLKKERDMQALTQIEKKTKLNAQLSKEELEFLYEINGEIEGFGYQKDPRIQEIRKQRNLKDDLLIVFECEQGQIAINADEVNEKTKAYIGPLYPNIFKELPDTIEHVYTTFPEGKVYIKEIEISIQEKTPEQHEQELETLGIKRSDWGHDVIKGANLKEGLGKKLKLIIPTVTSLGFPNGATRQQVQEKAKELGIANELLPAITGIELRKQYTDQPLNEYILIDMEAIPERHGNPAVFRISRNSDSLWLGGDGGRADRHWGGDYRWAFLAS